MGTDSNGGGSQIGPGVPAALILEGLRLGIVSGGVASAQAATLTLLLPATSATLFYTLDPDDPSPGASGFPLVRVGGTAPYALLLDGVMLPDPFEVRIGRISVDGEAYDQLQFRNPDTNERYIFRLAGPDMPSAAEYPAFAAGLVPAGAIFGPIPAGQPFAPATPFAYSDLPGSATDQPQLIRGGDFSEAGGIFAYGDGAGTSGSLTVGNGATLAMTSAGADGPSLIVGRGAGAFGGVTVAGPDSAIAITSAGSQASGAFIDLGRDGGTGVLRVFDGGEFRMTTSAVGDDDLTHLRVGSGGGIGRLVVEESLAVVQAGANASGRIDVGLDNGTGVMIVSGQGAAILTGGAESPVAEIVVGDGGTGTLRAATGLVGVLNIAVSFDAAGNSVQLPGDGGLAALLVGINGGDGLLDARNASLISVLGAQGADLVVGRAGGQGSVLLDNQSQLDVHANPGGSAKIGVGRSGTGVMRVDGDSDADVRGTDAVAEIGLGEGGDGQLYVSESSSLTLFGAGLALLRVGHDGGIGDLVVSQSGRVLVQSTANQGTTLAEVGTGIGGGDGIVEVLSGGRLELRAAGDARLILGANGGEGALFVSGAGSSVAVLGGSDGGIYVGNSGTGSRGLLHVADQAVVTTQGRLIVGDPDPGNTNPAAVVLAAGTVAASSAVLNGGSALAGSGAVDLAGTGLVQMIDAELRVGDGWNLGAAALVSGIGLLSVDGNLAKSGGQAVFEIGAAGADRLDVTGTLGISGSTVMVDWIAGATAPTAASATMMASAADGITLQNVTLETGQPLSPALNPRLELRAGDTELWFVTDTSTVQTYALTGTVALRGAGASGANPAGTVVTFTPGDGGVALVAPVDATGAFAFDLAAGTGGTLSVARDYTAGSDRSLTALDALEVLRMVAGLGPSNSANPLGGMSTLAADFNGDGQITAMDALGILLHVGQFSGATAPQWLFADDPSALPGAGALGFGLSGLPLPQSFGAVAVGPMTGDLAVDFTGILSGDAAYYPNFA